jgi:hypothetical protein
VRGDAECNVVETRVGPNGSVQFVRRVDEFGLSFTASDVYSPELDPSPARGGNDAGRFGGWEVAAK